LKVATDLAKVLHNTIFVDQVGDLRLPLRHLRFESPYFIQVKYSRSEKENVLHLLEEHITENIVKVN
jgi:hypothetical protein